MTNEENKKNNGASTQPDGNNSARTQPNKSDEISISKKTLADIVSRLENNEKITEALIEEGKKKDKKIEMLTEVADKGRLARYEQTTMGPLISRARVSFWEGVPILAWEKVKDEVGYRDGRLIVSQVIRLFLDEKDANKKVKTVEVDYLFWSQNTQSQEGEVVARNQTKDGNYWTVEMKDGRKVEIDIRFVNAF